MALTQRLQIRQSQALVMTPQLMQAIKLLQLSNLDLVAYVEAELERNPLLDRSAEDEPSPRAAEDSQPAEKMNGDAAAWNGAEAEPGRERSEERLETPLDDTSPADNESIRPRTSETPAGYSEWATVGSRGRDDGEYNLESFVSAETTLATGWASNWRSPSPTRYGA